MSDAHGVARDQLRAFIERIERLLEEKKTIEDDIKDIYGEAKGTGFIPAMIKKVIALRKKDEQQRMEEEAILDTYLAALGMLAQHDLFEETPAATKTAVGSGAGSAAPLRIQPETVTEHPHHLETTRGDESGTLEGSVEDHGQAAGRYPESQTDGTVTVTAGETATNLQMDREEMRVDCVGHSLPAENARKAITAEGSTSPEDGSVTHAGAGEIPATLSEIDPNEDRSEGQSLGGDVGANLGGSHVTDGESAQPEKAGGLVCNPPAKSLRPHCLRPENCGGYGSKHCFSCNRAAKANEDEEAA